MLNSCALSPWQGRLYFDKVTNRLAIFITSCFAPGAIFLKPGGVGRELSNDS